jgi:hypothetical protein
VRLSPLGMSATNWPIVPATDDRWWVSSSQWNENWQGKPKYSEKICLSATLSTSNPTWPDVGSNLGRHGGKPVTKCLSYGTAKFMSKFTFTIRSIYGNGTRSFLNRLNCGLMDSIFWGVMLCSKACLLGLLFDPEDGGHTCLWNAGELLLD